MSATHAADPVAAASLPDPAPAAAARAGVLSPANARSVFTDARIPSLDISSRQSVEAVRRGRTPPQQVFIPATSSQRQRPDPSSSPSRGERRAERRAERRNTARRPPPSPALPDLGGNESLLKNEKRNRPEPAAVYGFVGWITTLVCFVVFLLWAYLPADALHTLGVSYYPSQYVPPPASYRHALYGQTQRCNHAQYYRIYSMMYTLLPVSVCPPA